MIYLAILHSDKKEIVVAEIPDEAIPEGVSIDLWVEEFLHNSGMNPENCAYMISDSPFEFRKGMALQKNEIEAKEEKHRQERRDIRATQIKNDKTPKNWN